MDISEYRARWECKPVLRLVYQDYYNQIALLCRKGRTLEIGGGSGNLNDMGGDIISTDIQWSPWLSAVADAQRLPFAAESFDNIVMVDVLHHVQSPLLFFTEAVRVLRPGGRVVMLEPAMTPVAQFFYRHFHDEPVDTRVDPFAATSVDVDRDPYDGNQALPHLIFSSHRQRFDSLFPQLAVITKAQLSLFAYPLSGGFKPWSLLPVKVVPFLLSLERRLVCLLGPVMAFRMLVVVERASNL